MTKVTKADVAALYNVSLQDGDTETEGLCQLALGLVPLGVSGEALQATAWADWKARREKSAPSAEELQLSAWAEVERRFTVWKRALDGA